MNIHDFPFPEQGELLDNTNYKLKYPNLLLRCESIELHPTNSQLSILKKWFSVYRWSYNQAIKWYRKNPSHINKLNFNKLRTSLTRKYHKTIYKHTRKTGIPKHTIDNAFNDVLKAYKSARSNYQNGNIKKFRLRYKKETKDTETLCLDSPSFSKVKNGFAIKSLGVMKSSKPFGSVNHDSRLTWNKKINRFIMFIPIDHDGYECQERKPFIALDPGIRTFQTGYDREKIVSIGEKEGHKIQNLIERINKVTKYEKKYKNKAWYKKYIRKKWLRIQNIRDDLHWKTALKLVRNYDLILVGNMSTMSIINKETSVLNGITKQKCSMLSHYKFNSRLKAKAEEYGSQVKMIDEKYTTQTCGKCFHRKKMGGEKVYKCSNKECDFEWGRDANSSRLIALRHHGLF